MVVDAVGEPYAPQILVQGFPLGVMAGEVKVLPYSLKANAYFEIVLAELVEGDVTSGQCGFAQIIDVELLPQRHAFPSGQLVAQHLDVGEPLVLINEFHSVVL